jgi:hypothetical protein|tara:strand:- start:703 stop:900 length:198 start_codon:yes stop_codon:yes gene_type:complete
MPVKLKPSQVIVDRKTKAKTITHFFAKSTPKKELFDMLNNDNTKPKVKQKVRNELTRRGVKVVYA